MRLVKSHDEIAAIQSLYSRAHFLGVRQLTVAFETTPAALNKLLPPPLQPTPEAMGVAWIGEIGSSNCMGGFNGAGVYLRARYGDVIGHYCIAMPRSTPEATLAGREIFGEPAKLAKVVFEEQDEHIWGSAERHEVRYLSIRGRCDQPAPVFRSDFTSFFFKFLPRTDGAGFDCPPRLVEANTTMNVTASRRGRGELVFRESAHDPLSDIPVVQVLEAVYTEGQMYVSGRAIAEIDPDGFLPHAYIGADALDLLAENSILHGQAARKHAEGRGQFRKVSD
ncbi:MAG TPA: acetoacetate decarboxylase family protein [Dehalococcoidia bacterium]|nr:acetoacetate decarboxylase family protein [Dehalococcoidia bacterium]